MPQDISRHQSYNNRFRTSSSGGGYGGEGGSARTASTADLPHQLARQLDDLDLFGQSTAFARLSLNDSERQEHVDPTSPTQHRTSTSHHHHHHHHQPGGEAITIPNNGSGALSRKESHTTTTTNTNNDDRDRHVDNNNVAGEVPAPPTAPGRPRRISRQSSAGTRRHNFAAARSLSGGGGGENGNSASLDSAKDDVFVNVGGAEVERQPQSPRAEFDSSLFPSRGRAGQVLSTTSSSSSAGGVVLRPNPYNRLNHKLHDAVWLCSCLHFVFFCCLPAVHFMEQSDVRFRLDDHKGAGRLGRVSSALFLVGALLTLLFFSLLFFLVIYFTTR